MENDLSILVIEDTEEFFEVAKRTLGNEKGASFTFVSTFEEALKELDSGKKYDGVITDLFFPSQTNWAMKYLVEMAKNIAIIEGPQLKAKGKELPTANLDSFFRDSDAVSAFYDVRLYSSWFGDYMLLGMLGTKDRGHKNPSGLGIVEYCSEKGIPMTMITQGNRHHGDLAAVRDAIGYSHFNKLVGPDPLAQMCYDAAIGGTGKENPVSWQKAYEVLKRKMVDGKKEVNP